MQVLAISNVTQVTGPTLLVLPHLADIGCFAEHTSSFLPPDYQPTFSKYSLLLKVQRRGAFRNIAQNGAGDGDRIKEQILVHQIIVPLKPVRITALFLLSKQRKVFRYQPAVRNNYMKQ